MIKNIIHRHFANDAGSSLLEIIAALLIFGLVSVIAVPHLVNTKESFDRLEAKQQLEYWIARAQSISSSRAIRTLVVFSADGKSLLVGTDEAPYNSPPKQDNTLFVGEFPDNITISHSDPLVFDSRGFLVDESGNLTMFKIALTHKGESFCTVVLYSLGNLKFHC